MHLSSLNLRLELFQLLSRNQAHHLFAILGQFLVGDGELFGSQRTTLEQLLSKTGENHTIQSVESHTVDVSSLTSERGKSKVLTERTV